MTCKRKIVLPIIIVLAVSMVGMGTAYALTVTQDKGIGCGNRNWGERDHPNNVGDVDFGKTWWCSNSVSYEGRYNTAVITTELDGDPENEDIAWSAIYQGTTPWNENADDDGGAVYDNAAFPLDSDQSTDYNLKAQWVWTQDESPNNDNDAVYANYLTNLWFVWDKPGSNDYFLVIDFLWDQLEENGYTGNWKQRYVHDQDTMPGVQYYDIYCEKINGDTVYHYNVVLDNTSTTAGTWNERTANIETHIANAFSYSYDRDDECTDSTPGSRSNFDIVNQESGIEVQAQEDGATGTAKGAFSFSELWY
ncbi:MAG: hypothetical protein OXI27_03615 [Thaumarchaeota archaeon]|nr:hypothetical protein [Nitrososphaerota archaeon]